MLIRSTSCPRDLCHLSHQSTFLTDRNLQKLTRHPDPHGSYIPPKLPRLEASGCHEQPLSKGKSSPSAPPAHNPLTKPSIASLTRGRREFLMPKESPHQPLQTALEPASLIFKEWLRKDLHFTSTSQEDFLGVAAWRGSRKAVGRELNDESESSNCQLREVHRDPSFSETDLFVRRQEGQADLFSTSMAMAEPLEVGSSQLCSMESIDSREGTTLKKLWKKKKAKRRLGSLVLLNVLAALYGSSNVANGIVADAAPSLPVSLTSLVRFTSALLFFTPALTTALKNRDMDLLRAGLELGGLGFAATVVDSYSPSSGSSSSAALLFAFTVIFIPIMEIFVGRRSGSSLTRFATVAAISGMGLLEEEGFGWGGISCPQIGDLWGMAFSIISALHIFRSEHHSSRFDPLLLNAVQCGVLAILSLGWETLTTFDATAFQAHAIVDQIHSLPWAPLIYNGLVCFGLCSWLELHGLRSIHASTATLVYTTIPVWGAFLSVFAHNEAPSESALIGGLVIIITSVYAQMTTANADITSLGNQMKGSTSISSTDLKPDNEEPSKTSPSNSVTSAKDESICTRTKRTPDYFPGALLTSQLKFPYYAAQAKRLLAELKIKLGAIKSVLLTTVSSSIVTPTTTGTSTLGSPGVNPASGTAPAGAPSANLHEANSLPSTTSSISSVTSHIAKVDVSAAQHIAPHGPIDIVGSIPPSGSDIFSEALKATHMSDSTAIFVNVGTHIVAAVTTGLESAIIVVGSDIMLGYEETEDAATSLERLIQDAVQNVAHIAADCLSGWVTWLDSNFSNFVESTAHIPHELASGANIVLPFPSHLPEVLTNSLVQNVVLHLNHIQ